MFFAGGLLACNVASAQGWYPPVPTNPTNPGLTYPGVTSPWSPTSTTKPCCPDGRCGTTVPGSSYKPAICGPDGCVVPGASNPWGTYGAGQYNVNSPALRWTSPTNPDHLLLPAWDTGRLDRILSGPYGGSYGGWYNPPYRDRDLPSYDLYHTPGWYGPIGNPYSYPAMTSEVKLH
jgi:hypothetical protein